MLSFEVYIKGRRPKRLLLPGAYVFGQDDIPAPAEIVYSDNLLQCSKHSPGLAGLTLLWPVEGIGQFMMNTTRLEEWDEPYNLNLELARSRLMRVLQKREDWGLFDYDGIEKLAEQTDEATNLFLEAMSTDNQAKAAKLADESVAKSVDVSDRWADFCATVLLDRRV